MAAAQEGTIMLAAIVLLGLVALCAGLAFLSEVGVHSYHMYSTSYEALEQYW